jgi:hypothetical protein
LEEDQPDWYYAFLIYQMYQGGLQKFLDDKANWENATATCPFHGWKDCPCDNGHVPGYMVDDTPLDVIDHHNQQSWRQ